MGKVIGIDLGTTKSVVSIFEGGEAKIIASKGREITPSFVALKKDGTWIVGDSAKQQAVTNPKGTAYGVKRLIGRRVDDEQVEKMQEHASYDIVPLANGDAGVELHGKQFSPPEISAKILAELKKAAEEYLREEVTEAVITVPAYFNDAQRQATKDAGKIAGLNVLRIINEPTAAALAYGVDKKKDGRIIVYDLGGGTFDVSVLEIDMEEGDSQISVISTNGDTFLGGENFDERLMEFAKRKIEADYGIAPGDLDDTQRQRLKTELEKVKIELSDNMESTLDVPFFGPGKDGEMINVNYTITRQELEGLVKDLVDQTIEPCRKALADANPPLTIDDIDDVLLVGAQTRMPLVVETVKKFFGKQPRADIPAQKIVAMGAAVQGAVLSGQVQGITLQDVTPLSLGLEVAGGDMSLLIPRNSKIPTTGTKIYAATEGQKTAVIPVYQGERPIAKDNRYVGQVVIDYSQLPRLKEGTPLIVTFELDENSIITVKGQVKLGEKTIDVDIKNAKLNSVGGLSEDDIAKMQKDAELHKEEDEALQSAKALLLNAGEEEKKDYFTSSSEELKAEFRTAFEDLTKTVKEKSYTSAADLKQKIAKLDGSLTAITEAVFGKATPEEGESTPDASAMDAENNNDDADKTTPPAPPAP